MTRVPNERVDNAILGIVMSRDPKKELLLDSYAIANTLGVSQYKIRISFSRLRKRLIPFIPIKKTGHKGLYVYLDENNPQHQEYLKKYIRYIINQIRTMYFNDVVPYLPIVKDAKLKNEIGQMFMSLDGEKNGKAND